MKKRNNNSTGIAKDIIRSILIRDKPSHTPTIGGRGVCIGAVWWLQKIHDIFKIIFCMKKKKGRKTHPLMYNKNREGFI
jgi:hypothetical protein